MYIQRCQRLEFISYCRGRMSWCSFRVHRRHVGLPDAFIYEPRVIAASLTDTGHLRSTLYTTTFLNSQFEYISSKTKILSWVCRNGTMRSGCECCRVEHEIWSNVGVIINYIFSSQLTPISQVRRYSAGQTL